MKLKNIIWTAVVSALAGLTALIVAILGVSTDLVIALSSVTVAGAILSQREI